MRKYQIKNIQIVVYKNKVLFAEIQYNNQLLSSIQNVATSNEIQEINLEFFNFSANELKAISKEKIPGVKPKR